MGLLVVIDGSKALYAGVKKVFGDYCLIQRCQLHKRRNVTEYLPKDKRGLYDKKILRAFSATDKKEGIYGIKTIVKELEHDHPDAAKSLEEGLEEMFTVIDLKLPSLLTKTLTNCTQPIPIQLNLCFL